jgi:hypothetical protein
MQQVRQMVLWNAAAPSCAASNKKEEPRARRAGLKGHYEEKAIIMRQHVQVKAALPLCFFNREVDFYT